VDFLYSHSGCGLTKRIELSKVYVETKTGLKKEEKEVRPKSELEKEIV
jgi:hypothetical protein